MYDNLKIGTLVYAVHNKYVSKEAKEGRILVCRIKTFENKKGDILPVLHLVGYSKQEIDTKTYQIFIQLSDAINAIRS